MDATLTAPPRTLALVPGWIGARVRDVHGDELGHVADVLFDTHTRAPGWVLLALAAAGSHLVLAPARGLHHRADGIQLAFPRERVRTAPPCATPPDGLARIHALALAEHYGVRCGAGPWRGVVEPTLTRAAAPARLAGSTGS